VRTSFILMVLLAAVVSPARAALYEFTIDPAQAFPPSTGGRAVGIGDPALSQGVRDPSGDVYVLVPLQSVTVPGAPHTFPTLVFHGPAPGVTVTTPSQQYDINFGGGLPVCGPAPLPCVGALGTVYVSLVGLTSDVWGHFEGGTAGVPLVWVPNPDPGRHSFSAFAPPGVFVPFPGTFSMAPVVPEPPVALMLVAGLLALSLRQRRVADRRISGRS
jgi:hypothetical protein